MPVYHILTASEINYGIINLTKYDGMRGFFSKLPQKFDMYIKGERLLPRKNTKIKIWISFIQMQKFKPGDTARVSRIHDTVYVE